MSSFCESADSTVAGRRIKPLLLTSPQHPTARRPVRFRAEGAGGGHRPFMEKGSDRGCPAHGLVLPFWAQGSGPCHLLSGLVRGELRI